MAGWLPRARSTGLTAEEGEGIRIPLVRFEGEKVVRGVQQLECCDCGLMHLFTYELRRERGQYVLVQRPYRVGD